MAFLKTFYLHRRFFAVAAVVVVLFIIAYTYAFFFIIAQIALIVTLALVFYDVFELYFSRGDFKATRLCAERFSNGDENKVQLVLENKFRIQVRIMIIDEVPFQFQRRDIDFMASLESLSTKTLEYQLRPVERGEYSFGVIRVFVNTAISLVTRRFDCGIPQKIRVYPSYLQIEKYELMAISNHLRDLGIKKMRKVGHNIEFEHIKEYVVGDDFRTINWKATARKSNLMVNLYQDEKSQNVYSLIDKGRVMKMPFRGLSLLDYAINSSLMVSNVAIKKEDNAGIMTFEKKFDGFLPAGKQRHQMHRILDFLYNQETTFGETDYSNLFVQLNKRLRKRSLLLLYTNFESVHSLERQLPYFKKFARSHVLVVIFFKNTELDDLINNNPDDTLGIYQKVIAGQFAFEKVQIVKTLRQYGIQSVLARPEELSIQVINKYIELKARQLV